MGLVYDLQLCNGVVVLTCCTFAAFIMRQRCADCKAIYPQWSAVSFGILVCLSCAGKHRSLGVSVSFVKSLGMDSWSQSELRLIEVRMSLGRMATCVGCVTLYKMLMRYV